MSLPPLRDIISRHGLRAKKSLGQHFLLDLNLTQRIARAAGNLQGRHVVEVGAGPGGLTRSLLESDAESVTAIEKDERSTVALQELEAAYPGRLKIITADALETNLAELVPAPRKIVSNLPYNIGTLLLLGWLRQAQEWEGMTLMFQKEVADRLAAQPGSKAFGRLAIITQWLCEVRSEFNVSPKAFTPSPKVSSSVITLQPRPEPLAPARWEALEKITRTAFGQRRKMLRTSLKSLNLDLEAMDINPTARAEELDISQFCALARALDET
jgi:16S rRNA (adenine1518-N6/adenine1519-N6)-dimethyltransferase